MQKCLIIFVLILSFACTRKHDLKIVTNDIFPTELYGQCHASTIVEIRKGELLAAWFGGTHEGASDVTIWGAYFKNGKWTNPFFMASGFDADSVSIPCWNPVLFVSDAGRLFLFYKVGKNPREWWGMVKFSDDAGISWGNPVRLPDGVLGPIKNKPVSLANGTFLCPSSIETLDDRWIAHLELFSDDGQFLNKIELEHGDSIGAIQPSVLFHPQNKLQILCRSRQNRIAQSWSHDGGKTWEEMSLMEVQNPNSGTDAVTLKDGRHLLVYNPLLAGKDWWEGRHVLNLAISDNGLQWKDVYVLENQTSGEFSYPSIIQDSDGMVHITYTWQRKKIKHVILNPNEL